MVERLDEAQLAAVTTESKLAMVVAGAGAGKTRVLVERIAYLVEKHKVQPAEILAMTFTRKAAQQMRDRLEGRLGNKAHGVTIGTIHSLALKYVKMFGDRLGLRSDKVSVYGPWEEAFLLKDTARRTKTRGPLTVMEEYYKHGIPPADDHPQKRLFDVFMHLLRQNNAVTYGMLIVAMGLLVEDIVKRQIHHLLVDEVQDIDPAQWAIIYGIRTANPDISVFIVGDIDQSIYEWRGAAPETMLTLDQVYQVYKLETNYRSRPEIVEAADRLIQHNIRRIPKRMVPHREVNKKLPALQVLSGIDSATAAGLIAEMHKEGSSVAILGRTHFLLVKLSQELEKLDVPHHYCGREGKLLQSEPFRRSHAILQLLNNRYDNFSFALAREILLVTDGQYTNLMARAAESGVSHLEAWLTNCELKWATFFELGARSTLSEIVGVVHGLVDGTGYDVAMSLQLAASMGEKGMTLEEYLEWVATYDIQEDVKADLDGVQLMTIHAAKGLEFPTVLLVGWNEGLLPSSQSIPDEIEQERRLAYVALTRAENVSYVTTRPESSEDKRGRVYVNPPSRFIQELGVIDGDL